jgi:hypothetical protein
MNASILYFILIPVIIFVIIILCIVGFFIYVAYYPPKLDYLVNNPNFESLINNHVDSLINNPTIPPQNAST